MPQGPVEDTVITLERTGCYGTCPAYWLELRGDGTARYRGEGWVLVAGLHVLPLDKSAFACLLQHVREADFWSLPDEYVANVTDNPTYQLTVRVGGQTKTVKDYRGRLAGMPVAISQLEAEVDSLGAAPWVRGNGDTLGLLEREGFNFHSDEAGAMLARALMRDDDAMATALLAKGAPPWARMTGWYPADFPTQLTIPEVAAYKGNLPMLRTLIDAGAVGPGGPPGLKDRILLAAANSGDLAMLKLAMSLGPDVNARDSGGDTALICVVEPYRTSGATAGDRAEAARLLIAAGADVNLQGREHKAAIHKADDAEIVRLLIAAGANVKAHDERLDTALHYASDPEVARLLIAAGADVDARDDIGRTPLLMVDDDDVGLVLLQAGADPRAVGKFGDTVFKELAYRDMKKSLAYLRAKGIRR